MANRVLAFVLATVWLVGCGRDPSIDTTYGERRGGGALSVNGTTVLSEIFTQAGFEVGSWRKLSPRLSRYDVIVWAPDTYAPPRPVEVDFLEDWLSQANRTLIYIGRDYDAHEAYWQQVVSQTVGDQRLRARRKLAQVQAEGIARAKFFEQAEADSCRWFGFDRSARPVNVTQAEGPWAANLDGVTLDAYLHQDLHLPPSLFDEEEDPQAGDADETEWSADEDIDDITRVDELVDASAGEADDGTTRTDSDADVADAAAETEDESNADDETADEDAEDEDAEDDNESLAGGTGAVPEITERDGLSEPAPDDPDASAGPTSSSPSTVTDGAPVEWHDAKGARLASTTLLSHQGRVMAARISSPSWGPSKLVVVHNGSWLLNLPLIEPGHRKLAESLVNEARASGHRVCFLESGDIPLAVSQSDVQLPPMLQAITVWPVNLLVVHLLLIGIVYCFYVFPIFGVPTPAAEDHVSDFGKHVHAYGELLEREQDEAHARNQLRHFREWRIN